MKCPFREYLITQKRTCQNGSTPHNPPMKTTSMAGIGFPISHKENEHRRAILPVDIWRCAHPECLVIEAGYGNVLNFSDSDYVAAGARVVSREEVLKQPIVCDPKVGDADYLSQLKGQTIFGWVHAVLNRDITDKIIFGRLTAYAWEEMYEGGRHVFWRNNEIAGEAAIAHAYLCHGVFPYSTKVAVLGRGNTARGAIRALYSMGADVRQYERHSEALFRNEMGEYDVIVNAILWDKMRKDHIVYRSDLRRLKRGAMIVDISCDRAGAIETSIPTTIADPVYMVDGVLHYVVDHTPALFYKSTSEAISHVLPPYLDSLIEGKWCGNGKALIVKDGVIVDQTISLFQGRT